MEVPEILGTIWRWPTASPDIHKWTFINFTPSPPPPHLYQGYLWRMHLLSHLVSSSLLFCAAAPSSMPRAYRCTSWQWTLSREGRGEGRTSYCDGHYMMQYTVLYCTPLFSNLQRISVKGRISPSQFHTDTDGDLLQHRPHRKGLTVFWWLLVSCPGPLSDSRCWEPLQLPVSV